MRLGHAQEIFTVNIARLIIYANTIGYRVRGKEWNRTQYQADYYAKLGIGSKDSQHIKGLAFDIALFLDGKYLRKTEDYRELGEWWEMQHPCNRWGGNFKRKDGCHFEMKRGHVNDFWKNKE